MLDRTLYSESNYSHDIDLCEVGDILYKVGKKGIKVITITDIRHYPHTVYEDDAGYSYFNRSIIKSCFNTKEEAEKEVQRLYNIQEKRKRLKEYEEKLNQELGIVNHYIIK